MARILRYSYIAECNDSLVQRLGLERLDQLIGARITDVVLDSELIHNCIPPLIHSGYRHRTLEVTSVDSSGKRGYYLHAQWGIVENGKLQRVWGSSRDITELRRIEAQFRHAQKLESIGRLAAGVAHDFNNLLTIIQGFSAQLLEGTRDGDNGYIGLTEIRKVAEKGAVLTNQLLAFSRKQETELRVLDLKTYRGGG